MKWAGVILVLVVVSAAILVASITRSGLSLPKLTMAEVEEMKSLNPKTNEEWEMETEARKFLEDDEGAAAAGATTTGGR